MVLLATGVDVALSKDARQWRRKASVLLAFSAWTNGKKLLTVAPPDDSNFTCIHGIRVLSALWIILGHRHSLLMLVPFMNPIAWLQRLSDKSFMMAIGATLSVDTFFLIGGMVNCYTFMMATRRQTSYNWIRYYVHRYIRLTPTFALMIAITATWLSLLSTGPLWYAVMGTASETCRRHWLASLLYVANYANPNEQCMAQSWYLMVDMQLHWLSPLLLYPLWKWRRVGLAWLGVVLAASAAIPAAITYAGRLPSPVSPDLDSPSKDVFMRTMYFPTHTRLTPYVFGTLVGFVLFLLKTRQLKVTLTKTAVLVGWMCSAGLCLAVLFGEQPLVDRAHHKYDVWEATLYAGLHRVGWSIGVAWVVLACIQGYGGPVNAFLSWSPFTVLSRLVYGIYLTHVAVVLVDAGTIRSSEYYSDFKMVEKMFSDFIIASIVGACLWLCAESPVSAIEKMILTRRNSYHRLTSKQEC